VFADWIGSVLEGNSFDPIILVLLFVHTIGLVLKSNPIHSNPKNFGLDWIGFRFSLMYIFSFSFKKIYYFMTFHKMVRL